MTHIEKQQGGQVKQGMRQYRATPEEDVRPASDIIFLAPISFLFCMRQELSSSLSNTSTMQLLNKVVNSSFFFEQFFSLSSFLRGAQGKNNIFITSSVNSGATECECTPHRLFEPSHTSAKIT